MMATIRQQMIDLLEEQEMNVRDLSQELHIMEEEVYDHLAHIERTLSREGKQIRVEPFQCLSCGYRFEDRRKWTRPGRCPVCRKSRIRQAVYRITAGE
ncbi:MAG: transcriptional regulator [Desulfobulbaceae bacterium]